MKIVVILRIHNTKKWDYEIFSGHTFLMLWYYEKGRLSAVGCRRL